MARSIDRRLEPWTFAGERRTVPTPRVSIVLLLADSTTCFFFLFFFLQQDATISTARGSCLLLVARLCVIVARKTQLSRCLMRCSDMTPPGRCEGQRNVVSLGKRASFPPFPVFPATTTSAALLVAFSFPETLYSRRTRCFIPFAQLFRLSMYY